MTADAAGRPCILAAGAWLPLDPAASAVHARPECRAGHPAPRTSRFRPRRRRDPHRRVDGHDGGTAGAEFLLSFTLGAHELMAKIAGRALPNVGDSVRMAFNMSHAHVFDAATGRSLRRAC
jgi:hypothetical protein